MRYSRVGCYSSPWAYCLPLPGEAVEPAANLVAVAAAPPTIDAALKAAYDAATLSFPFSAVIVADPDQGCCRLICSDAIQVIGVMLLPLYCLRRPGLKS